MNSISRQDVEESMRRLQRIPDKDEWKTTTTRIFKLNIAQYLSNENKKKMIEFGGAQGHTAYFVSPIVDQITSIEFDENNCEKIKELKCANVTPVCVDLYSSDFQDTMKDHKFDIAIIDAIHKYDNVKIDIENARSLGVKEIIFDDYGAFPDVKKAVDEFIEEMKLSGHKVKKLFIGMPPGSHYPNTTFQTLSDWEGLIVAID
jgi:hypothetical protein